jgi:VIT1/CCC1 family predicted Fe2+/Mn2+ transporter
MRFSWPLHHLTILLKIRAHLCRAGSTTEKRIHAGYIIDGKDDLRIKDMINLRRVSFGTPAAIVTSMALIVGLDAATANKATVAGSLLIAGLADNLTDSLSIHIYQESEKLAEREALITTAANFISRIAVSLSFVLLFLLLQVPIAIFACVIWGFILLSSLSFILAKVRNVNRVAEILKHASVAMIVILVSEVIGLGIEKITACL